MPLPSPELPPRHSGLREVFGRFARWASNIFGSVWAFVVAIAIILIWAATGPIFHFSDTWQLIINTGTTIVTFLMVFLIQSTQNRDARAIHLKLDELIRSVKDARNKFFDLENMTEDELDRLSKEFSGLQDRTSQLVEHVQRQQGHAPRKHEKPHPDAS